MFLAEKTIKNQVSALLSKLGVRTRVELAVIAVIAVEYHLGTDQAAEPADQELAEPTRVLHLAPQARSDRAGHPDAGPVQPAEARAS